MEYEIRGITENELIPYSEQMARTFGNDFNPEHLEARKQTFEFDRNLAVLDAGTIVGTAGIYTFKMNVPGGDALGCAGVTMVTVRSTHRRKGVLTALMRKQLHDVRERGEPLAALWASEAAIYGRFGYGVAIQSMELKVRREWAVLRFGPESPGRVRLVGTDEARSTWPAAWERAGRAIPGWVSRTPQWWETRVFRDHKDWRDGFTGNYYAQYEDPDGEVRGLARYRLKQEWAGGVPNATLRVEELGAETPQAYAGLWRFIASVDLIGQIEWENASVDEPLYWMLADSRRMERRSYDSIWVRLVDIERSLGGRQYSAEGRVVFGVRDPFLPWCDGSFELDASRGGAICRATNAEPEIVLSAADLATVYLGGARLETLRRAGRVEGDASVIRRADVMFGWDRGPHCPEHF
ncbi:MAG TPA: GNAT family N-acetyltransferase [Tepidiformaceae bacterium]|nr:GNAT family N-acetyltransferase [Tepidiformaceae bacterium]